MHGSLTRQTERDSSSRFADWRLALKSILGFWLFYYLTVVARAFLSPDPLTILVNKALTLAVGIALTGVIYLASVLFARGGTLKRKIIVGLVASLFAGAAQTAVLFSVDRFLDKPQDEMRFTSREGYTVTETGNMIRIERAGDAPLVLTWPEISQLQQWHRFRFAADSTVMWFFFFAAWTAFYVAMHAQSEALGARRRAAEAESAARAAQVRALRYQVNPHFLFNTLNSLSSLVMAGRPHEAEEMILKLSTFFRTSLSLDPSADVTLAQEIELQQLYLDIEKVRFPKRLKVEVDVPAELENARVPGLILQPVVENAIKYAVSGSRQTVVVRIVAREVGPGRFTMEVTNSSGAAARKRRAEPPAGTGVGLANVCQRLTARFGSAAQCEFGPLPDGGYRVAMILPLDRADA